MTLSWRRIAALLEADLHAMVRDRMGLVGGLVVLAMVGASGPVGTRVVERLLPDKDDDAGAAATWDCRPGELGPVATAGDLPGWFVWPEPLARPEDAELLIRPGRPGDELRPAELELVELTNSSHRRAVADCLWSLVRVERRLRLDALGISEDPRDLSRTRTLPPAPPRAQLGLTSLAPLTLLGGLAMVMMSVFLELGPRARQSGWLETYVVLPGSRRDLVFSWWIVGLLTSVVGAAVVLLGGAVAALATGGPKGVVPLALLPPMLAVLSALGVRAFVDVADIRTAMVQAIPVLLAVLLLGGLAAGLEARLPGLGGLMPLGGLLLAVVGRTDGIALAVITSLAATVFLLVDAARVLDGIVIRQGAAAQTASRRAAGNYLPEVGLLSFIAMAGVGSWAPPEFVVANAPARTALSLGLFLGLPALLVNLPLRLERGPLLSWRPPPPRAWLTLPFLLAATVTLAGELWRLAQQALPHSATTAAYVDMLGQFRGPWGLLALSVAPGICEELLFRGAILGLLRRKLPVFAAVLLQASLFAVLHALAVRLPYTFALGLILGVVVVRTGSLWPAILAHTAHNLLSALLPERLGTPAPLTAWTVIAVGLGVTWWGTRPRESRTGSDPGDPAGRRRRV